MKLLKRSFGGLTCHDCFRVGVSFLIGLGLLALLLVPAYYFLQRARRVEEASVVSTVQKLAALFTKINKDAHILGFELEKTPINFLTVRSFVGSTVGSMSLEFPAKWAGPYSQETPKIQDHYYYVLKNDHGYYIVPGDGVELEKGKTIGKDIVLGSHTPIEELLRSEPALLYEGQPLIVKLALEPQRTELIARLEAEAFGTYVAE